MDAAGYEDLYPTTDEVGISSEPKPQSLLNLATCFHYPRAEDNDAWMIGSEGLSEAGLLAMKAAAEQNEEDFFKRGPNFIVSHGLPSSLQSRY